MEAWKDIEEYEGLYQASSKGRIRSMNRIVKGNFGQPKPLKSKVRKQANIKGYLLINLCKNGVQKTHYVHIFIAKVFTPNPFNKPEVNHINGIKSDNRAENLEWVTHQENIQHAYDTGLMNKTSQQ